MLYLMLFSLESQSRSRTVAVPLNLLFTHLLHLPHGLVLFLLNI